MSYLLGLPQEVENVGLVYPVKIKDYARFSIFAWTVEKTKKSLNKEDSEFDTFDLLLEDYINESQEKACQFIYSLQELLKIVLQEKDVEFIEGKMGYRIGSSEEELRFLNSSNFDMLAEIVRNQNVVFEKRYYPFKEFEEEIEKAKRVKNKKGANFDTILSIVSIKMCMDYTQVSNLTYMQLLTNYQRIMFEKDMEITTILRAGGFNADISSFTEEINLLKTHPDDLLYKKIKGSEIKTAFGF